MCMISTLQDLFVHDLLSRIFEHCCGASCMIFCAWHMMTLCWELDKCTDSVRGEKTLLA